MPDRDDRSKRAERLVLLGGKRRAAPGVIWLVGAGPGDADLLTVKALKVLQRADVVVHDGLVSDEILSLSPASARRISVAKRKSRHSYSQDEINRMLVAFARQGLRVVRLKGGDPFIFGRGGEEAETLRAHGITVEVVNGITSGLAAATSLGAPLTHRAHAHGVLFVTGHARSGGEPLHWPTLAATAAEGITLVIYMGVAEVARLQAGLLQGLPASTPVAVVQHASLPTQRSIVTHLAALAGEVAEQRIASPAIIVVGDVLLGLRQVNQSGAERANLHAA